MWVATKISSLAAGRGAGSSFRTTPNCRKLCVFSSLGDAAQAPADQLVVSGGREFICGHASVRNNYEQDDFLVAQNAFDRMPAQDAGHSTPAMSPRATSGGDDLALMRFSKLRKWGAEPDEFSLSTVIRVCGLSNRIDMGLSLHCLLIKQGFQDQIFISSNLIAMYSKCARVEFARRVFDEIPVHDAVSWNSMVASYLHNGLNKEAMDMLSTVLQRVCDRMVLVNNFTLSGVLRACAVWGDIRPGRSVHGFVLKLNFEWDVVVMGSLIDMYAKHGSLDRARLVFDNIGNRDLVAWNAMISGCAQHSHEEEAVELFQQMQSEGFHPNEITFTCIVMASARLEDIDLGRCVHANLTKQGYLSDSFVGTALVDMYSKCSEMEDAECVFMLMGKWNLVSFNALVTGYGLVRGYEIALQAYIEVRREGMVPDPLTFTGLLSSCSFKALAEGSQIHCHIIKFGFDSDISLGNSLIGFYAKCSLPDSAAKVFETMMKPNAICWAGIISCFVQNDEGEKALKYFQKMLMFSEKPDEFSLSAVFKAVADWAAAEQGKHLHALGIKIGLESAVFVGSALVDLYCKCGMVEDSLKMFMSIPQKNIVSWNAMIIGLAQNGLWKKSLELFHEMVDAGITPNSITSLGVLVACNHAGLVDEGRSYFNLMASNYGISPTIEHYTCMVDLLGRTGHLHEAEVLTNKSFLSLEPGILRSFIASQGFCSNKEMALKAYKECVLWEPRRPGTYVLLSNVCALEGLWSEVTKIRNSMKDKGIRKEPGLSWIEIKNKILVFSAEQRLGFPQDMMTTLLMVHLEMRICS